MRSHYFLLYLVFCSSLVQICAQGQTVYISNRGVSAVNTYDLEGNFLDEFISPGSGGLQNPQDILPLGDGTVIVSSFGNSLIKQYDALTGAYIGDWGNAPVAAPSRLSYGPDGTIYVTQWGSGSFASVVRFDTEGNFLGIFATPAPQGLGLIWDSDDNLYVGLWSGASNGTVRKFDPDGVNLGTFVNSDSIAAPTYVWFDSDSTMLVQDWFGDNVLRYDQDGSFIETFIDGLEGHPEGFAYLPNGNLLIAERTANKITEWDSNGQTLGQWNEGPTLFTPNFIRIYDLTTSMEEMELPQFTLRQIMGSEFQLEIEDPSLFTSLTIIDIQGREMDTLEIAPRVNFNTDHYSEGTYFVFGTTTLGRSSSKKFIVTK